MTRAFTQLALLCLFVGLLSADTVSTRGQGRASINGNVKTVANGVVVLEAQYKSGKQTLTIPLDKVESIEFNLGTYNQGAPPKTLGIGPAIQSAPVKQAPAPVPGTLTLRPSLQRKDCKLIGVDDKLVRCQGKGNELSRSSVFRIQVSAP